MQDTSFGFYVDVQNQSNSLANSAGKNINILWLTKQFKCLIFC